MSGRMMPTRTDEAHFRVPSIPPTHPPSFLPSFTTPLASQVALKVMNVSEIKEEYVVRNLHREAKLLGLLSHPCVAALYETMQCGAVYYMATELVAGGDLCSFIKAQRSGRLDERLTRTFARQLVSALTHMHSLGIVHR